MSEEERNEYEALQEYFLQREGKVLSKKRIDRINELGKMSVEDRRRKNTTDINFEWVTDQA